MLFSRRVIFRCLVLCHGRLLFHSRVRFSCCVVFGCLVLSCVGSRGIAPSGAGPTAAT
jgi:hypothetical protein